MNKQINNKLLKAFTMIELLVVLSIIGIIFALIISGMFGVQRAIQVQLAIEEVMAVLKETRSLAENNTLTATEIGNTDLIYGFHISFAGNDMNRKKCLFDEGVGVWDCSAGIDQSQKSKSLGDIEYFIDPSPRCNFIFENLSGDIFVDNGIAGPVSYDDKESCRVQIRYAGRQSGPYLEINGENNTYKLHHE